MVTLENVRHCILFYYYFFTFLFILSVDDNLVTERFLILLEILRVISSFFSLRLITFL